MSVRGVEFVDQIWWFMSRAAGSVAWVLLSFSMLVGMSQTRRGAGVERVLPAGWSIDLHRFLSMLSLTFLTVHLFALIPDNFVDFGLVEVFVPMMSNWEPSAVAWGVVGFWLMVSVEVTSLLRSRIPNRVWRAVHLLSFVVWVAATVHLFMAGTDVANPVFRVVQVVLIGSVAVMFMLRIGDGVRRSMDPFSDVPRPVARDAELVRPLPVEETIDIDQVDPWEGRELAA